MQNGIRPWHSNQGNLLLALGIGAGLLMCVAWYFNLVPDIQLLSANERGSAPRMTRGERTFLVATLRPPVEIPLATDGSDAAAEAMVEIYPPAGRLEDQLPPLLSKSVALTPSQKVAVVFELPIAEAYAVLVYLDLNGNRRLDFGEANYPVEPFRLSHAPGASTGSSQLEDVAILIAPGGTGLVECDFSQRAE